MAEALSLKMLPQDMSYTIRHATKNDVPRMLEISSGIEWGDYVPYVIDLWLSDEKGEVTVAESSGEVVGFAKFSWLLPGYAWFEGIRTDKTRRNSGVGKAITDYFLAKAKQDQALKIGLSTYIENHASIHIIEQHGFRQAASFIFCEEEGNTPLRERAAYSDAVVHVSMEEACEYILASRFLQIARGYLPTGWKFYPFAVDPKTVLAKMRHVVGIKRNGRITALLCSSVTINEHKEFCIDFIDGEPEDTKTLLLHALYLANSSKNMETMIPKWSADEPPALAVMKELGFNSWNNYDSDVLVFERVP